MSIMEVFAALGAGGLLVEVVRHILGRNKLSADTDKTRAETDATGAEADQAVVNAAKDVVTLLREDNAVVREELREERRQRLRATEAARARERGLIERISRLEIRLATAEEHAREVGRLRAQVVIASNTIDQLQSDVEALGGVRRVLPELDPGGSDEPVS